MITSRARPGPQLRAGASAVDDHVPRPAPSLPRACFPPARPRPVKRSPSCAPSGMPWPSTSTIHFVPFAATRGFANSSAPFFRGHEAAPFQEGLIQSSRSWWLRAASSCRPSFQPYAIFLPLLQSPPAGWTHWGSPRAGRASGLRSSAPTGFLPHKLGWQPRAVRAHLAFAWVEGTNTRSAPTAVDSAACPSQAQCGLQS